MNKEQLAKFLRYLSEQIDLLEKFDEYHPINTLKKLSEEINSVAFDLEMEIRNNVK